MDKLPSNFPAHEGLEQKLIRINQEVKDSMNTIIGYLKSINDAKDDEEMHNLLKNAQDMQPVISYKEYMKKNNLKTTAKEINFYYEKFDSKMSHIQERLVAPDSTKQELLDLYKDLNEYTTHDK